MKKNKIIQDENIFISISFLILLYFLITLVSFSIFKIIKIDNCFGIVQLLSFSIPIATYFYIYNSKDKKAIINKIIVLSIYFFCLIVLPFLFGRTYDYTIDGNSYHKTAIGYLKNGWNPIYESSSEFQKDNDKVVNIPEESDLHLWIDHYPKASWIVAANMYNMTGNIESGKCLALILAIVLGLLAYNCLFNKLKNKVWSIVLSLLLCLNPIFLVQIFTYYVDGLMGICFAIELFLLLMMKPNEKTNYMTWIMLVGICSIFVNLKFTGLVYSGVLAAFFYFYWLFKNRKNKEFKTVFKRITLGFIAVFFTSIFVVGTNSYGVNAIRNKNPLYPLFGKDKVDIITTMQPKSFSERNMIEKIFLSIYSKTENVTYFSGDPTLKVPFKVYGDEVTNLQIPDCRIGGFGPLYSVIFSVTLVLLISETVYMLVKKNKEFENFALIILSVIASIILIGEGWWARYVPQLYILTILAIYYALLLFNNIKYKKCVDAVLILTVIIVLLNLRYFFIAQKDVIRGFNVMREQIYELQQKPMNKIELKDDSSYGCLYNFDDYGIKYEMSDTPLEEDTYYFYCNWKVKVEHE